MEAACCPLSSHTVTSVPYVAVVTAPMTLARAFPCPAEYHLELQQVSRNEMACPGLTWELTLPQASAVEETACCDLSSGWGAAAGPMATLQLTCASASQPVSAQDRAQPMLPLVCDSEETQRQFLPQEQPNYQLNH